MSFLIWCVGVGGYKGGISCFNNFQKGFFLHMKALLRDRFYGRHLKIESEILGEALLPYVVKSDPISTNIIFHCFIKLIRKLSARSMMINRL